MLRDIIVAFIVGVAVTAALLAAPSFAQDLQTGPVQASLTPHDRFVIASDECAASRYRALVGRSYQVYRTVLPADAIVHGAGTNGAVGIAHRTQQTSEPMTLEFRPQQLNVVVDAAAQIVAIGCY
jgi:hypothetical protein